MENNNNPKLIGLCPADERWLQGRLDALRRYAAGDSLDGRLVSQDEVLDELAEWGVPSLRGRLPKEDRCFVRLVVLKGEAFTIMRATPAGVTTELFSPPYFLRWAESRGEVEIAVCNTDCDKYGEFDHVVYRLLPDDTVQVPPALAARIGDAFPSVEELARFVYLAHFLDRDWRGRVCEPDPRRGTWVMEPD